VNAQIKIKTTQTHRAFHMGIFRRSFAQTHLRRDLFDPPFLIANMSSMPDKWAARL